MLTFGVDVGIHGAIACLGDDGSYMDVQDLPIITYKSAKWIDGIELLLAVRKLRQGQIARAIVERVHAMPGRKEDDKPGMGTVAANSKGMTLGSTLATLQIAGCAIEIIEPQTWKRALGLLMPKASDGEKKTASLELARKLFPKAPLDRFADNGRAEALLIAWSRLQREKQDRLEVA